MTDRKDESALFAGLGMIWRGLRFVGRGLRAVGRWIMHRLDRVFERRAIRLDVEDLGKGFDEFVFDNVHTDDVDVIRRGAFAHTYVRMVIVTHGRGERFIVSLREW